MTAAIGTVGQGEFMSSKSLVEAAKIILSARPEGLSEDMLVHILLLDDRPFTGLGAHVYGTRGKGWLAGKTVGAIRRTPGMTRVDGRWIYDGPPPAEKVAYDEAVVNLTPPTSPSVRCCKECNAQLRSSNQNEVCDPCGLVIQVRERAEEAERERRRSELIKAGSLQLAIWDLLPARQGELVAETGKSYGEVYAVLEKLMSRGHVHRTGKRSVGAGGRGFVYRQTKGVTEDDIVAPVVSPEPRPNPKASPLRQAILGALPGTATEVHLRSGIEVHRVRTVLYQLVREGRVDAERIKRVGKVGDSRRYSVAEVREEAA